MDTQTKVTGVILAGGLARRMGHQDKGLLGFKGKAMVDYAIEAMGTLADPMIINANRNIHEYQKFGMPVVSDLTGSFDGPLAGILTAMQFAETGILLVMPCDSPFFKAHHLQKLLESREDEQADVAIAFDGERLHPIFLAVKTCLKDNLQAYLDSGQRKVETWLALQNTVKVDFSNEPDIFININSFAELSDVEAKF